MHTGIRQNTHKYSYFTWKELLYVNKVFYTYIS